MNEELGNALGLVLEAWDYNGGGDAWSREVHGDNIKQARKVLETFKQATAKRGGSRCRIFISAPPPDGWRPSNQEPCIVE